MGTPLSTILHYGSSTVPPPLLPGTVVLDPHTLFNIRSRYFDALSKTANPDRCGHNGFGHLDVRSLQSPGLWKPMDEEPLP